MEFNSGFKGLIQSLESVILQLLRLSPKLGFYVPSLFTSVMQRFSEKLGATSKFLVPPEWWHEAFSKLKTHKY